MRSVHSLQFQPSRAARFLSLGLCSAACSNDVILLDAAQLEGANTLILINDVSDLEAEIVPFGTQPIVLDRLEGSEARSRQVHAFRETLLELGLVEGPVLPAATGLPFPSPIASLGVSLDDPSPAWAPVGSELVQRFKIPLPCTPFSMRRVNYPERVGVHFALPVDEEHLLLSFFDTTLVLFDFQNGFVTVDVHGLSDELRVTIDGEKAGNDGELVLFEHLSSTGGYLKAVRLRGNVLQQLPFQVPLPGFLSESWAGGAVLREDPLEILVVEPKEEGTTLLRATASEVHDLDVPVAVRARSTSLVTHEGVGYAVTSSAAGIVRVDANGATVEDLPFPGSGSELASLPGFGLAVGSNNGSIFVRAGHDWQSISRGGTDLPGAAITRMLPSPNGFFVFVDGLGNQIYEYRSAARDFCLKYSSGNDLSRKMSLISGKLILAENEGLRILE